MRREGSVLGGIAGVVPGMAINAPKRNALILLGYLLVAIVAFYKLPGLL